eukprot:m.354588 g.354588  ORF g.354588 m.354588 type:complete len:433 (-) comp17059_c0_seq1:515-1813(-)
MQSTDTHNLSKQSTQGSSKANAEQGSVPVNPAPTYTSTTTTMADEESRKRTTSFVDPAQAAQQRDGDFDPLAGAMHGMNVSDEGKLTKVLAKIGPPSRSRQEEIHFGDLAVVGNGSFGVVFKTKLVDSSGTSQVALKKVLQDRRYKNRELELMRQVAHTNIVILKWFFLSPGQKNEVYLNLIMEYMPTSLSAFSDGYAKRKIAMPVFYVKLSVYQMFRALAYLHGRGICHRDIKPQNLLLNVSQGVLKLCDFGCAKVLQTDAPNVSYICSRYYRAPELCLGSSFYTHAIDVWSGACVMAELLMNRPIFRGSKSAEQMEKIMRVLGHPTRSETRQMNPEFRKELTTQSVHSLDELLRGRPSTERAEEVDLLSNCFNYVPTKRPHAIETLLHPFFDELQQPGTVLPNGNPLPPLFDFTPEELAMSPGIEAKLRP